MNMDNLSSKKIASDGGTSSTVVRTNSGIQIQSTISSSVKQTQHLHEECGDDVPLSRFIGKDKLVMQSKTEGKTKLGKVSGKREVASSSKKTKKTTNKKKKTLALITAAHEGHADEQSNPLVWTPLSQMSDYHEAYNVQLRATKVWSGRLYGKDQPNALVFLGKDREGTTIEVVATGQEAERWSASIVQDETYEVTNICLGRTDKQFKVHRASNQLFIQPDTDIKVIPDDGAIGFGSTYYHKLNKVGDLSRSRDLLFSVVGYVVDISPTRGMPLYAGGHSRMVELYMIDDTVYEKPIVLTVWDDVLNKYKDEIGNGFKREFILTAREVRAKPFDGQVVLESTGFTTLQFGDLNNADTGCLLQWIKIDFPKKYASNDSHDPMVYDGLHINSIADVVSQTHDPPLPNEPLTFNVIGNVVYIFTNEDITYASCPKCNKKVVLDKGGEFTCNICNQKRANPLTSYRVRATIEDPSDQADVVLFGAQAQLIMREPVDVIKEIRMQRQCNLILHRRTRGCLGIKYLFILRVTDRNHRFIPSSGFTVVSAKRVVRDYKPRAQMVRIEAPHSSNDSSNESIDSSDGEDIETGNVSVDEVTSESIDGHGQQKSSCN